MRPVNRLPWHPSYLHLRVEEEEGMISIPTRVHNRVILAEAHPHHLTTVASMSRALWSHPAVIMAHSRYGWADEEVVGFPELPLGPATPGVRDSSTYPTWVDERDVFWPPSEVPSRVREVQW